MVSRLKSFFIGKPLKNEDLKDEKLDIFWGLPIMASDAISSVAYAVEEILWVLVGVVGLLAYRYMFYSSVLIVLLLLILVFSYSQTIDSYPHGGGSYTVARENLGETSGLIACASLIIGYILTVAVSTSAGTAAITSAIPALLPYNVIITIILIIFMTIGNLRGVKESARIFAIPTYIFIFSMLLMIVTGLVKVLAFGHVAKPILDIPSTMGDITLLLFIRAFAAGCAGLTGVEAVSNAIPNFKYPSQKNAKKVLLLLALCVLMIFGGISYLATIYHAVPNNNITVMSQIATQVFGHGFMYYIVQICTAIILVMAANTSFAGLPMLLSLVSRDGYAPRQFNIRGWRLGYSNGIIALSVVACLLIIIYNGDTHRLVPLYAIGVFISFTLSQIGMLSKWLKSNESGRIHKAIINGFGSIMTIITVIIIAYSKFVEGAWIAIVLIGILVYLMKATNKYYTSVENQLKLDPQDVKKEIEEMDVAKYMIVIINSINRASLKAINYARHLTDDKNLVVFNVSIDKEESEELIKKWDELNIPISLVVKYSPYREIVNPLAEYVQSEEHASSKGDLITIVMPQFVVNKLWFNVYHHQTGYAIRQRLLKYRHVALVIVPYVLHG